MVFVATIKRMTIFPDFSISFFVRLPRTALLICISLAQVCAARYKGDVIISYRIASIPFIYTRMRTTRNNNNNITYIVYGRIII